MALGCCGALVLAQSHPATVVPLDNDAIVQKLMEGNARFSSAHFTHPNLTAMRRREVAAGQHPVAAVLSCADSRVPPELIFDQAWGICL